MGFFDDDPFNEIVREFFGSSSTQRKNNTFIQGEEEDRSIDFVEDQDYIYIIFELPGYTKKDISVSVKGNLLEIKALKKEGCENIQSYLSQKLCKGMLIQKTIPKFINPKNFKYTLENGILEIIFSKK